MLHSALSFLLAQTAEAVPAPTVTEAATEGAASSGAAGGANPLGGMLPMIVIFIGIMYFLMIRPQQKRDKERKQLLASIAKGDVIVTTGGIYGTIANLTENEVILEVDKNITMKFLRSAVAYVAEKKDAVKS